MNCLYIVYKYLGMTPSGTIVVLLLFFIFLVFPCFILLFVLVICAFFHTCMFLMELSLLIKNLNLCILSLFLISLLISGVSHGISCFCLSVFDGTCLSIISWILVLISSHFSSVVVCIVCLQK